MNVTGQFSDATACFGLRVQGDSMIRAHIQSGDLAIIRRHPWEAVAQFDGYHQKRGIATRIHGQAHTIADHA